MQSINIKKYTKEQMAQMVEEAQEGAKTAAAYEAEWRNQAKNLESQVSALKQRNAVLTEQIEQMNGEAINRANELTNLKADLDITGKQMDAVSADLMTSRRDAEDLRGKLTATETALGRANAESARLRSLLEKERRACYNAEQNAKWAAAHPWRNLWAWFRRKA